MAFRSSDNWTPVSEQSWSTTQFLSPWHWEVKLQIYGTKDNLQVVPPRQKTHKAAKSFFCPSSTQPGRANCSGTTSVSPSSGHDNAQMKTEQTTVTAWMRMRSVPNWSQAFKSGTYPKNSCNKLSLFIQTLIHSAQEPHLDIQKTINPIVIFSLEIHFCWPKLNPILIFFFLCDS